MGADPAIDTQEQERWALAFQQGSGIVQITPDMYP